MKKIICHNFDTIISQLSIPFVLLFILFSCSKNTDSLAPPAPAEVNNSPEIIITTILSNQGIIWGFDVLPNGNLLYTQKTGSIQLLDVTTRNTFNITGLPNNVSAAGQGGMLDLAIAPDYTTSRTVFVTYSITGGFLVLASFVLNGNSATNWKILMLTESASTWNGHFGSRITFGADGKLFWSVGEGGNASLGGASSAHQNGQKLNTIWGKIHRLNLDGTVPADNPIIPGQNIRTSIYSYGHRNPQGMAFEPKYGNLFINEHGPNGGCELNKINAGSNYGWPLFSNGINYNGSNISNGHKAAGITEPLKSWSPAMAPSGLTFINHTSFKDWNGNLLMGSLTRRQLLMIKMTNGVPQTETILLEKYGRIRNVKMGPEGKIYVSVEDGGRLLTITAKGN